MANNPMTRKEIYLAKMAGEDVSVPEPMTREETYLKKIAENGGSGGGGDSGVLIVTATIDGNTITLGKTWNEISASPMAIVYIKMPSGDNRFLITSAFSESGVYSVNIAGEEGVAIQATTDSADGYPSATQGG